MGSRYRMRDLVDNPRDTSPEDMLALAALHRALKPKKSRERKKKSVAYVVFSPLYIAGIFLSWPECEQRVRGVPGAEFRGYPTVRDAEMDFKDLQDRARERGIRLRNLRRTK